MWHGGITGFEVKIGQDGGIPEPGTWPSLVDLKSETSKFNSFWLESSGRDRETFINYNRRNLSGHAFAPVPQLKGARKQG